MVYWFGVGSRGDSDVNLPPQRPWTAPHWLARNRQETESLLGDHTQHFSLRVDYAIDEALNLVEVYRTIERPNQAQRLPQDTAVIAANETQGIAKRAIPFSDTERTRRQE